MCRLQRDDGTQRGDGSGKAGKAETMLGEEKAKPETKPETKPERKPETKLETKLETKPETKPETRGKAGVEPAAGP